jgi:hypothetical protein
LGVDHTNVVPNSTWGRLSFRINTFQVYNAGLFVLSMDHIPTGPSSGKHDSPIWPAWWLAGDEHWNSEFDMFEGYEPDDRAFITLHNWDPELHGNCTIPENITQYYNGSGHTSHGMSQFSPRGTSLGPFNQAGGGVYAMQWDHENFIREWTFVKPNVPADLLNVSVFLSSRDAEIQENMISGKPEPESRHLGNAQCILSIRQEL